MNARGGGCHALGGGAFVGNPMYQQGQGSMCNSNSMQEGGAGGTCSESTLTSSIPLPSSRQSVQSHDSQTATQTYTLTESLQSLHTGGSYPCNAYVLPDHYTPHAPLLPRPTHYEVSDSTSNMQSLVYNSSNSLHTCNSPYYSAVCVNANEGVDRETECQTIQTVYQLTGGGEGGGETLFTALPAAYTFGHSQIQWPQL
jgi:hypothetical protein